MDSLTKTQFSSPVHKNFSDTSEGFHLDPNLIYFIFSLQRLRHDHSAIGDRAAMWFIVKSIFTLKMENMGLSIVCVAAKQLWLSEQSVRFSIRYKSKF
jgi:hypothetical protein